MADGNELIVHDEILYRRISVSGGHYQPQRNPKFSPNALLPNKGDLDGISLYRSKYVSAEKVGVSGKLGKVYWVVAFKAASFFKHGFSILPCEDDFCPRHVVISEMNFARREALEEAALLIRLESLSIEGPFTGTSV